MQRPTAPSSFYHEKSLGDDLKEFEDLLGSLYKNIQASHSHKDFLSMIDSVLDSYYENKESNDCVDPVRISRENVSKTNKLKQQFSRVSSVSVIFCFACLATLTILYSSNNLSLFTNTAIHQQRQILNSKLHGFQIGTKFMSLKYLILRSMRMLTSHLGLLPKEHSAGTFTKLFNGRCILTNPAFLLTSQKDDNLCHLCNRAQRVLVVSPDLKENQTCSVDTLMEGSWCHLKGAAVETNFQVLQHYVSEGLSALKLQRHRLSSNVDFIISAEDLGNADVASRLRNDLPSHAHIVWTTDHYAVSRIIRKVFPIPPTIAQEWEASLTRNLLVDGDNSPSYKLLTEEPMYVMYIQGLGSRKIKLAPHDRCTQHCRETVIITRNNDVLIFDAALWSTYSMPVDDQASFAFWGYLGVENEHDDDI